MLPELGGTDCGKYYWLNFVPPKILMWILFGNRIIEDVNNVQIKLLSWALIQ